MNWIKNNKITDLQNYDKWEIQLKIAINVFFSKDIEEHGVVPSMSGNIKLIL